MSEFKFNIVGKDGKIIEDLIFDDIDSVADYMLDAADKWYAGLQDPGDNIIIERIEDGKVVFEDKSSFGGCLLYTSPSPRDATLSRMPSSA